MVVGGTLDTAVAAARKSISLGGTDQIHAPLTAAADYLRMTGTDEQSRSLSAVLVRLAEIRQKMAVLEKETRALAEETRTLLANLYRVRRAAYRHVSFHCPILAYSHEWPP